MSLSGAFPRTNKQLKVIKGPENSQGRNIERREQEERDLVLLYVFSFRKGNKVERREEKKKKRRRKVEDKRCKRRIETKMEELN